MNVVLTEHECKSYEMKQVKKLGTWQLVHFCVKHFPLAASGCRLQLVLWEEQNEDETSHNERILQLGAGKIEETPSAPCSTLIWFACLHFIFAYSPIPVRLLKRLSLPAFVLQYSAAGLRWNFGGLRFVSETVQLRRRRLTWPLAHRDMLVSDVSILHIWHATDLLSRGQWELSLWGKVTVA
jgi:hypothetical protein